ncbi:MAG: AMP-binding protein [Desulfobacterales bacterium]|nr:AMP-binding protein [Desulfobacterales bacterium]
MARSRHLSFFDIYEKNARLFPDRTALHWNQTDVSYSQLLADTRALAQGLSQLDLAPGSTIGILSKNHPGFFHLLGAASALNLCLVLMNRRLGADELDHIVQDTRPALLICDQDMESQARDLVQNHTGLDQYLTLDGEKPGLADFYKDERHFSPRDHGHTDPWIIIHTAAVQGKPRGAVLSQENVLLANLQLMEAFPITRETVHLNILPLFHIMGINLGLGVLQAGGKNILVEKFDPPRCLDLIQDQQVTLFGSFPPILSTLMDAAQEKEALLSSLSIVAGIDAPDTMEKWEAMTSSRFWTMYGQTETSGLVTFSPHSEKPGSAGRISHLARIEIGDDRDQILDRGQTGEILVKGPLVFQGYWNCPDLNAHTARNGWHHTGDLGMIDGDGFLYFKGRKAEKELIKPGGENVFPAEVENAILRHGAVKEVCVFGVPDPKFGEGIKAVCSLHPGKELDAEGLIAFTGSCIAGYKKPRYVDFIDQLPKTQDGHVDREKIKRDFS